MKKIIIAAVLLCSTLLQVNAQKIKGSNTCLPLTQKEAESYIKANADKTGGGSGVGISALIEGSTDIAMSSRRIKFDEKTKIQDAGKAVKEKIIAYDALAIVVNPANKVSKLIKS